MVRLGFFKRESVQLFRANSREWFRSRYSSHEGVNIPKTICWECIGARASGPEPRAPGPVPQAPGPSPEYCDLGSTILRRMASVPSQTVGILPMFGPIVEI